MRLNAGRFAPALDFHPLGGLSVQGPVTNAGAQESGPVASSCLVGPLRSVRFLSAVPAGSDQAPAGLGVPMAVPPRGPVTLQVFVQA